MSTKAQDFKAAQQRTGAKKAVPAKSRRVVDPGHTDTRNVTKRGDKQVGMALEDSESGRPSRKSTRASAHHGRADTGIMRAVRARSQTAKARAQRAEAARR